ncbi:MAG: fibronectin type III-like domain-contianing protein [Anaerolineae bacterium]
MDGKATDSVDVTDADDRAGDQVVQRHVHEPMVWVTRPLKDLRNLTRPTQCSGEAQTTTFTLMPDKLAFLNTRIAWGVESGAFTVKVGGNSAGVRTIIATLVA